MEWNDKRRVVSDRRGGAEFSQLCAEFRSFADEEEHRVSYCLQRRGAF